MGTHPGGTHRELSIEYQHDRVWIFSKDISILVLWMKVASALEGLTSLLCAPWKSLGPGLDQ